MTNQPKLKPEHNDLQARYASAEYLLQGIRNQSVVQNDSLTPYWIEGSDCFWYQRNNKDQHSSDIDTEYRLVDAQTGSNQPAFDHLALAKALAGAAAQEVKAQSLPLSDVSLSLAPVTVSFTAFEQRWCFDSHSGRCQLLEHSAPPSIDLFTELLSPNGEQIAFLREHNIWLRDVVSGQESPLTQDGEEDFAYGASGSSYGIAFSPPGSFMVTGFQPAISPAT